ncbi:MAG: hypothetical protein WAO98_01760 [Alphaproteobacteria bacterium]
MSDSKASTQSEIQSLASEVMDLWQEHLAVYASDPSAKAELMRLLEPQRRLFADWASMMQNGFHAGSFASSDGTPHADAASATARTASSATASDDSALRLAQFAHRLAELEKRLDRVEAALNAPAPKTQRRTKPSQH